MNSICIFLGLLSLTAAFVVPAPRASCSFDPQDGMGSPQPLLLKADATTDDYDAFHLPTENQKVQLEDGEVIVVACPGGTLKVSGTETHLESSEAVCNSGKFEIEGKTVSFNQIYCSRLPFHTARYTNATCNGNHQEVEIGFILKESNRFIRMITLCFDEELLSTDYSYFTLSKAIAGYQSGFPRPDFVEDDFYPFRVNGYYVRNKQRETVNRLVGLSSGSTKYVASSSDYFMSRGHMTAKADFIYGSQQRATFHYVNVAPQWQTFNGRNWNTLEMNIRDYVSDADSYDTRYTLYTGTHGVTTLPHEETGEDIPLYLYVNGNEKLIPVPQYYWRVLQNEDTGEAVAFVGINNPYHYDVSDEIICESICDRLSWLKWKGEEIDQGYSYCCTVEDLRKTITNVPDFEVTGLLL